MAPQVPPTSPYVYDSGGDYLGRRLTITVSFDNASRLISGAVVHRDPGCVYTKIYVGTGADGTPDSTPRVFGPVPDGDTSIPRSQFTKPQVNISTIEDFIAMQVTAGP